MRSLFIKALFFFVGAALIFLVFMTVSLFLGFNRSLTDWSTNKSKEIRETAISLLQNPDLASETTFPGNIPVFIYDDTHELVFTNRGASRRREAGSSADVDPLVVEDQIIGYFHIGNIDFQNDYANQQLIQSMTRVIWIGVVVSWITSIIFALIFSRSLSRPARLVAAGINRIADGSLDEAIPEQGVDEISQIAHAANNLRDQLLKEKRLRTQWAQDIAHDLRTPISALKAQFEGMLDGVLPMNTDRIKRNIGEVLRVENLINDLQELMTLETPELRSNPTEIDLELLTSQLATAFSFKALKKNVRITREIRVPRLLADEDLLLRALSNIMNNAIRHSVKGGEVRISTGESDGRVMLKIHNDGDIIPEEELGRVFDRLYRGDHARNTPGSGLGLTISRQIVELHGGKISIASDPTAGTTVEIRLPGKPPAARRLI